MPSSEDYRVAIRVSSERPFGAPNATPGFVDGSFDPARPHSEREARQSSRGGERHQNRSGLFRPAVSDGNAAFGRREGSTTLHSAAVPNASPRVRARFYHRGDGGEPPVRLSRRRCDKTPARTTFAHDPMSTRFGNALVNIISPRFPTVPPSRPQASPDLSCTITSTMSPASAAAFFVP